MMSRRFLLQCVLPGLIVSAAHSVPTTWIAQSPNHDLNDPSHWNTSMVPGSGDVAIFNSAIAGIDTNPISNSIPFSVSDFNFPNNASSFNFVFNNSTLTFNGTGITGSNTNPTIDVSNINNSAFPGNLVSFLGGVGTSGGSRILSLNSGALTGMISGAAIGAINSHIQSSGPFFVGNGGNIVASNTGNDSTSGTGNNGTSNTAISQLQFDQSFTAGDNVVVAVSNSGTFSGTNTMQGDSVAIVNGSQFRSTDAFQVGDNFICGIHNTGNDSSNGVGLSNIGQLNAAQMLLQTTGDVGKNCAITLSNTGINSSAATAFPDFIGYLNDQQFFVGSTFQAGENFSLEVSNTGTDTSNGHGACQVAAINSNSGTTGNQILFQQACTLGVHATVRATNSGTYSGMNTNGGCSVGLMNLEQIAIGDRMAPGSYMFFADDYFSLSASNRGIDSSNGTGADAVGVISSDQITFFNTGMLRANSNITITNSGNFSGNASTTYVNVGSTGGSQLNCASTFVVGDYFTLNASNTGTNTGTGIGGYFIGDIITGQQVKFQQDLFIGTNAVITIANSGSNSSNTTNNNQVGSFMGYGKQLLASGQFQIGNNLLLQITNSGFDNSSGAGGNFVGFMNNNTVDQTGSQLHLNAGGDVGHLATIAISNAGTYQGTNASSGNIISVLAGAQFNSVSGFRAGNNFELTLSNEGINNAVGQSGNSIATTGRSQLEFGDFFDVGNNALIALSNSGTNNDAMGTINNVGVINGSQMAVAGSFIGGTNLRLNATNTSINGGDSSNFVGRISGSQLFFAQDCNLNDGSRIYAFNSGEVTSSQITFNQGFNVISGQVSIQAVNAGTAGPFGITIEGNNVGGNALILLSNCGMNVGTTFPAFTIAGLDGNSTSFVQSLPQLIINTDAVTQSVFSGVIQDFPATNSTLAKQGPGTLTLSGINTYTGLTSVLEGILSINGAVTGDVTVSSGAILKGTGTIGGLTTIDNGGTLSPGNSVGTITLASLALNPGSTTVIEIDPTAASRIHVTGNGTVDGALQIVRDLGGYPHQGSFLILDANPLSGAFSSMNTVPGFTFNLSYVGNEIYLDYLHAIPTQGLSGNSLITANYLNANAPPSLEFTLLAGVSGDELNRAMEMVSPARNAFGTYIAAQTAFSLSNIVSNRMDEFRFSVNGSAEDLFLSALTADNSDCVVKPVRCKPKNKYSAWISGLGEFSHQSASLQNPSFNFISEAALVGLDYHPGNRGMVGGALGFAHTHYYEDHNAGDGNINYFVSSLYGNAYMGDFYLAPCVWGIFNKIDNTRNISFPGYSEEALAHITAWQLVPHLEAGYNVHFCWGDLIPFTAADWAISWQGGYTEYGLSSFNAKQKANHSSMVRSETGLKFYEQWEKCWGFVVLKEKASYIFEKPFGIGTVNTAFVGMPGSFTVTAVNQNLNLGSVGINCLVIVGKERPVRFDFGYDAEFGANYWSNELLLIISNSF